jgi:hypothetical protein
VTTFTMRRVGGEFVVTSPDIEPMKFKTRREARDWCAEHYPRFANQRDRARSQAPDRRRNGKRQRVNRAAKATITRRR